MDDLENAPESMDDVIGQLYDDAVDVEQASVDEEPVTTDGEGTEQVADAEPIEDTAEKEESEEPAKQTINAPQSMSAKDREAFYALPPEQQSWIAERVKQQESDYTKKTMELADQRKVYEKLEQIIAPRREQLAMSGMDDSTAIGQLFALSDYADRDPVGFVKYLFNQRGIPIDALTQSGGGNQAPADPQFLALQRELDSVKGVIQQQTQAQQAAQAQNITKVIDEFASDPANPFYSDLEQDMIPIVQALRAQNPSMQPKEYLAKAYKMALSANDEVSAKVEADRKAKEEAERVAKAKEEAAKAKKAKGTSISSKSTLPAKAAKAKDVDSFISALVDERMAG